MKSAVLFVLIVYRTFLQTIMITRYLSAVFSWWIWFICKDRYNHYFYFRKHKENDVPNTTKTILYLVKFYNKKISTAKIAEMEIFNT